MYAGTGGGMFVSHDAGSSWVQDDGGLSSAIVDTVAVDPTSVYEGNVYAGVQRSSDGGVTWNLTALRDPTVISR